MGLGWAILYEGVLGFVFVGQSNRQIVITYWAIPMIVAGIGYIAYPVLAFLIGRAAAGR